MPSEDYRRFLDSMVMGFNQWHDGTGYDLEALSRLDKAERASIEALLIGNLKQAGYWRDVEALVAVGTPSAQATAAEARHHPAPLVRHFALGIALDRARTEKGAEEEELEEQVIRAVEEGAYEMAQRIPTARVKQALLDCAWQTDRVTRVKAAALLLYLCGLAPEPFDWSQRPFFLQFAEDDPEVLDRAWAELRRRTGL